MEQQLTLLDVSPNRTHTDWEVDSQGYDPTWDDDGVRVQKKPETTQKRTLTGCGKLEDAIKSAHNLSDRDLDLLGDAVSSMLQARGLVRVQKPPETPEKRTLTVPNEKATPKGSFERKKINGHGPYLYLRWWSGGRHRSTYLGKMP